MSRTRATAYATAAWMLTLCAVVATLGLTAAQETRAAAREATAQATLDRAVDLFAVPLGGTRTHRPTLLKAEAGHVEFVGPAPTPGKTSLVIVSAEVAGLRVRVFPRATTAPSAAVTPGRADFAERPAREILVPGQAVGTLLRYYDQDGVELLPSRSGQLAGDWQRLRLVEVTARLSGPAEMSATRWVSIADGSGGAS